MWAIPFECRCLSAQADQRRKQNEPQGPSSKWSAKLVSKLTDLLHELFGVLLGHSAFAADEGGQVAARTVLHYQVDVLVVPLLVSKAGLNT